MKIDMHMHSRHSKDSMSDIEKIIIKLKEKGIDGFALTDHESIAGHEEAERLAKTHKLTFIKGVEWRTNKGDITAYNVTQLPKTTDFFKCIDFFKKQGAKISVAHPFDFIRIKESMCDAKFLKKVLEKIDFIELNGRCLPVFNKKTWSFAKKHNIKLIAGSDGHTLDEYGNSYTEFDKKGNLKGVIFNDSYLSIINLLKGPVIFIIKKCKLV